MNHCLKPISFIADVCACLRLCMHMSMHVCVYVCLCVCVCHRSSSSYVCVCVHTLVFVYVLDFVFLVRVCVCVCVTDPVPHMYACVHTLVFVCVCCAVFGFVLVFVLLMLVCMCVCVCVCVCVTDPVPRDNRPRGLLLVHWLPFPQLDAVGPDLLRHHLHHPLRQLLLPDLPPQAAPHYHQGSQDRHQWCLRGNQRGWQDTGWVAGGKWEEAQERKSEERLSQDHEERGVICLTWTNKHTGGPAKWSWEVGFE